MTSEVSCDDSVVCTCTLGSNVAEERRNFITQTLAFETFVSLLFSVVPQLLSFQSLFEHEQIQITPFTKPQQLHKATENARCEGC